LLLYRDREGQTISVEFDEYGEIQGDSYTEKVCLYVNFDLITENEK
jgi:hypothetical protein